MNSPEDELNKHFQARNKAQATGHASARAQAEKVRAQTSDIAVRMRVEVLPVMERIRDFLLERNYPADVSVMPDELVDVVAITLSCSDETSDYVSKSPHLYKFYASFIWQNARLGFRTNRFEGESVPDRKIVDEPLEHDELTSAFASERPTQFVKNCFPVPEK